MAIKILYNNFRYPPHPDRVCDCFGGDSEMCSLEKETEIEKALRNLCFSYGWSYGFFWRFHHRYSTLLTLEDAYSMEYARSLTDDMLLQVHMLGEGVIGQAALDGKHKWMFSDPWTRIQQNKNNSDSDSSSNFSCAFSSGIKTMVVIPVESCGVLQFGSVNEMLESHGFVDLARQVIREAGLIEGSSLISSCHSHSSYIQESEFGQNGSFFTDPISTTNNSMPIRGFVDNQEEFLGYNPLSFLGGFVDNQCLDSLFQEPSTTLPELPTSNADLFSREFETHFGNVEREETLEDMFFAPMKNDNKDLFSELGLDQFLSNRTDSGSFSESSIEDPICSPKKGPKKRARVEEGQRPRPKDRQMIQDRIKELREIVPNSSKCSIDSLLDRTIKHMIFMQGVTKYVDRLKQVDDAKATSTFAVEVGSRNPIVVEDLEDSGQMLIEMICEERGFILEIADGIRGFGLTILKGVEEARDGKIRAHFIVEANRHLTSMEVLMSLVQLLKESSSDGLRSVAEGNKVFGSKTSSLLHNYHHQSAYGWFSDHGSNLAMLASNEVIEYTSTNPSEGKWCVSEA